MAFIDIRAARMEDLARYYAILGLNPGASADQLRLAYRDLVKVWHPDRFLHDERLRLKAQDKLKEINGAYEVLRSAMFAAGTDPGPQPNPEPQPAETQASPESADVEPTRDLTWFRLLWAAMGAIGTALVFLAQLWWRPGHKTSAVSSPDATPVQAAPAGQAASVSGQQLRPILADHVLTVADDFVVDIFHNGERVPDNRRNLIGEDFGATAEKITLTVREGDWLVFNVVNDRLRWNAVYYFAAAGLKGDEAAGFASELESGNWSFCDDPRSVARFVAESDFLAENKALPVGRPWSRGDELMKKFAKGWQGQPVWGTNRNTWIKFRAVPQLEGATP